MGLLHRVQCRLAPSLEAFAVAAVYVSLFFIKKIFFKLIKKTLLTLITLITTTK
jgi:hypothetical protein